MTPQHAKAVILIVQAVRDAVKVAGPMGCPEGTLYAALMAQGCTLQQFESLIRGMVNANILAKRGKLLFLGLLAERAQ